MVDDAFLEKRPPESGLIAKLKPIFHEIITSSYIIGIDGYKGLTMDLT